MTCKYAHKLKSWIWKSSFGITTVNNLQNWELYSRGQLDKIIYQQLLLSRSSRPEVFCKKSVLWNFANRKTPVPESLFWKRCRPRPAALLKKRLWHRYFPVNIAKFLRTPLFTERLRWLLLVSKSIPYLSFNITSCQEMCKQYVVTSKCDLCMRKVFKF